MYIKNIGPAEVAIINMTTLYKQIQVHKSNNIYIYIYMIV